MCTLFSPARACALTIPQLKVPSDSGPGAASHRTGAPTRRATRHAEARCRLGRRCRYLGIRGELCSRLRRPCRAGSPAWSPTSRSFLRWWAIPESSCGSGRRPGSPTECCKYCVVIQQRNDRRALRQGTESRPTSVSTRWWPAMSAFMRICWGHNARGRPVGVNAGLGHCRMSRANLDASVVEGFGDEWRRFDQSALNAEERDAIARDYF